jgi:hypothetical protein
MDKRRFDYSDYSVVVKNRGSPPNSWKWEIYRAGRSNPIGQSPILFSHRGGGQQSREGSPEAVVEQAQHLTIALSRVSVEPSDFLPMFFPCSLLPRIR